MYHLSVILPVRNEAEHIADVFDSLLTQNYDREKLDIIVVDGCSDDNTPNIVQQYVENHPQIVRYFENPKRLASAARNIGAQNAKGNVVLFVDGHCIIDNNQMLRHVSEAFEHSGADCLGRPQPLEMSNANTLQRAIAAARRSPLGHHPDSFIYSGQPQFSPASSVAIAYRKSVFEKVGYFDESFDACEDVEFNTRIDSAGLTCYFEPAIAVHYVPRKTWGGLRYQMERYGRGRVRLGRKHRHTFSWKSFVPGLLALGFFIWMFFATAFLLMNTKVFDVMNSSPILFVSTATFASVSYLYLFIVLAESIRLAFKQKRFDIFPYLFFVFLFIHITYGTAILLECLFPKKRERL